MSLSLSPLPSQTNRTISKVTTISHKRNKKRYFILGGSTSVSLFATSICWHYFSSFVVDLVNTLHGQHVINPRVQANLVQQGHPHFLCRPIQLLYKV